MEVTVVGIKKRSFMFLREKMLTILVNNTISIMCYFIAPLSFKYSRAIVILSGTLLYMLPTM